MKYVIIWLAFLILLTADSKAQEWAGMMQDPSVSLFEVQQEFNNYFEGRERMKGDGYNVFRRWEYWMERHVDENGFLPPAGLEWEEYYRFISEYNAMKLFFILSFIMSCLQLSGMKSFRSSVRRVFKKFSLRRSASVLATKTPLASTAFKFIESNRNFGTRLSRTVRRKVVMLMFGMFLFR